MGCKKIEKESSSCQRKWKYDVFLSFRGEDTRNHFIDHLFFHLQKQGIDTFKDDVKLKKGKSISSDLLQAIDGSQVLIVVFSKSYASSTWCLQELAKIADCAQVPGQSVLPIFYDVDPSEVRKQSGNFGEAFVKHEERFKDNLEMVQRWREALTQVANLSGCDVRDKPQYKEIQDIIKVVTGLVDRKLVSIPSDIVGIHSRVAYLEELLNLDSMERVLVVGICGMGGIGKTALAGILYGRIFNLFKASCYIEDVSKIYRDQGPLGAPKDLLRQTLRGEDLQIYNLFDATNLIQTRLPHIKALIVLDNVDQAQQLEKLPMIREFLGAGSRIIVISRDEHILRVHDVDAVYQVQLLNDDNSHHLFCRYAFKCDDVIEGYINLTRDMLTYAHGLPLAIVVLGSFLFSLSVSEWESKLARLRKNPPKGIMDVLRISFDALDNVDREIFLDIACFDLDQEEEFWRNILDIRGFHPDIGLKLLIDKSLITCKEGYIKMHDLLRDLGRTIIKEESLPPKEPRMWSRLWDYEDFINVMLENKDTENVEFIYLYREKVGGLKTVNVDALSKMSRLKFLILRDYNLIFSGSLDHLSNELRYLDWVYYPFTWLPSCFHPKKLVELILPRRGSLDHLSNELRYLDWVYYPFKCLPSSFHPKKLVELILPHSKVEQLWEGKKHLPCLRHLNLWDSRVLIKMPHFGEFPNLELLNLEECVKLKKIDASIGILTKLVRLNLSSCTSLVSIPYSIFFLSSLEELDLCGRSKLVIDTNINESSIESRSRHGDSIGSKLRRLDLSYCNLPQIPAGIGDLHCLEELYLGGNKFDTLPSSIKQLSRLVVLNLDNCEKLKYLPELPSTTVCPVTTGYDFSKYGAGINIYDCPEWGGKYSMVLSWIIQLLKILIQPSVSFHRIDIIVPGTKIPRWFNIQSSRSIDLSPVLYDFDCIAVVFCATFVVHDPDVASGKDLHFRFRSEGFCGPRIAIRLAREYRRITSKLTHRLILLFNPQHFVDYYVRHLNPYHITFTSDDYHTELFMEDGRVKTKKRKYSTVKEFGYRCIYSEDLQR